MKVSKKRPEAWKVPVEITASKYEMWYMLPLNLGEIEKSPSGVMWRVVNGMEFKNSLLALDYLIDHWKKAAESVMPEIRARYEQRLKEAVPGQVGFQADFRARNKDDKKMVTTKMSKEDYEEFLALKKFKAQKGA